MRKNLKNFVIYWIVLFVIFNLITFITPTKISGATILELLKVASVLSGGYIADIRINEIIKTVELLGVKDIVLYKYGGSFWPGYIFVIATLLLQLGITCYFMVKNDRKSKSVGSPLIALCFFVAPIMMIIGIACMIIPNLPIWLAIVACSIILLIQFLLLMTVKTVQENQYEGNEKAWQKISRYKQSVANAKTLLSIYKDDKDIKKLVDDLIYSNSTSEIYLNEIDEVVNKLINKENYDENLDSLKILIAKRG